MTSVSNSKSVAGRRALGNAQVALIGCNHHTAPVELRERVAFTSEQALEAAGELRRRGILEEAVVLSTCNRSELYGVPAASDPSVTDAMEDFLTSYHRIPRAELHGRTYRWFGSDAVRHLFRVAAGLDSMLLGEAEILGQLRTRVRPGARQRFHWASAESRLSRRARGGKARAFGNRGWRAPDVGSFGRRETRGASFREPEGS